jgi:PAS domain-containing protein
MEKNHATMYQGLEEEVEFLRELIQASPQVIYVYNQLSNRLEYASGNLQSILGFSMEELQAMPKSLWDVVHPDDLPVVNAHVQKMKRAKMELLFRPSFDFDTRVDILFGLIPLTDFSKGKRMA